MACSSRRALAVFAVVALAALSIPHTTTAAPIRAARIRDFANRWLNTPYVWGGEDRSGIDCSGYVRQMFRDLFGVELPRTTRQQIELGLDVAIQPSAIEKSFQTGDLIFYIDREGIPNHVVVYIGSGQLTHSVSGRGVVVDPLSQLWGRRIVGRRLFKRADGGERFAGNAIPAAGPIVPREIPCPPSVTSNALEVRAYKSKPIEDIKPFGERQICELRALAAALRGAGTPIASSNATQIEQVALFLEDIDSLKERIEKSR